MLVFYVELGGWRIIKKVFFWGKSRGKKAKEEVGDGDGDGEEEEEEEEEEERCVYVFCNRVRGVVSGMGWDGMEWAG